MELIDKAAVVSVIVNTPTKNQHTDVLSALAFRTIEILNLIEKFSSIDAVPVVRCKDCKYWCPPSGRNDNPFGIYEHGAHCGRFLEVVTKGFRYGEPSVDKTLMWCGENDFCSYGERKGGEKNSYS